MKPTPTPSRRTDRRRFIAASSGAIGGLALGVHSSTAVAPSDDVLGVCIAGLNGRGGEHIRGFNKDTRSRIVAVVDVDPAAADSRAAKIADMQGSKPTVYSDIRKAIDDDAVDVLSVATPNHWHALMGVWGMQAGKDVYVEKPVSHNIHEGRALVAASKKYGRVFQTGTQCRSSTAIQQMVDAIAQGAIGMCNFARGLCYKRRKSIGPLGDYAVPGNIDFDLWSGPATLTDPKLTRKKFHYDWHWQRHYGNGDSGNQGPHQTDIARWGLGLDRHPQRILSYGGRLGYRTERNDPDYVDAGDTANTLVALYDYGDKSIVFETRGLDVSKTNDGKKLDDDVTRLFGDGPGNRIGVIFYGDEGFAVQTKYHEAKLYDRDYNETKVFKADGVGDAHFADFLDAVVAGTPDAVNADARTGHLSAAIAHLGNTSYYLGERNAATPEQIADAIDDFPTGDDDAATLRRTVDHLRANGVDLNETPLKLGVDLRFDPDAERFVDNADADAMLTRQYRPTFEVPTPDRV